ncbi:MAG: helicase-associated domain-containing protein [Candidatus Sumerlaeaceae bacterium]
MPLDRAALADSLKLRAALRNVDADTLASISDFWGFKASSRTETEGTAQDAADYLYPRLQAAQYFRPAFDRLSRTEKDLVYFLAIHGGEMGLSELAARSFRGNAGAARKAVQSLHGKGFLFVTETAPAGILNESSWISVPEAYLKLLELPTHWHGFLGGLLRQVDTEALNTIAERVLGEEHGSAMPANTLRARIRHTLTHPDQLRAYLDQIPQLERDLFYVILDRKGFCLYRDLLDTTSPKKFDHARAEHLNSLIGTSGLVYIVAEGANKYMNSLLVPRDLQYIISRKFQADTRSLQKIDAMSGTKELTPTHVLDNSQALLRDLAIFAARIDTQRAKRLTGGGISKTDLKKAVSVFPATKTAKYGAMMASFLIELGLLVEVNEEWRASEQFVSVLHDTEHLFHELWRWWFRTLNWSELYADGSPSAAERPSQEPLDILELRQHVLREIATSARDRWITFESFWENVAPRLEARFLKGSGNNASFGLPALRDTVAAIIGESLAWLGIVFYGGSGEIINPAASQTRRAETKKGARSSRSEARSNLEFSFQLTAFGRSVVDASLDGGGESPVTSSPGTGYLAHHARWLIIQPNLEIVAPPDLSLDAMFNLARFCEIKNMDVMTTLELTRDSLRTCLERGSRGEEILSFLSELSRAELPQTVRHIIEEYSTKHGEIRLGSAGGYIMASDPVVLESVRLNPKFAGYIKDVLGDNVMVLAEQSDLTKVAKELRNQGLMPHMETGTVHSSSDGRYHLSLTGQELYDLIASARFVRVVEQAVNSDISEGSAAVLAQRLSPESTGFFGASQGIEARSRAFQKRFEAAFQKTLEDIEHRYKNQVSKLVSKSVSSRGPSKYHYKGANPAVERADITELITFALEYDLEVELLYVKQNEQETRVVLSPRGIEGDKLYAHNPSTDSDGIYSIPRMLRAQLL